MSARSIALVAGAAGFLGSHLVDRLLADGYRVLGVDNLTTGDLKNLVDAGRSPYFDFEQGDVREPLAYEADTIFNFACPASPVQYQKDPYDTFTTSVVGVIQLLESARRTGCRIIHASTSEVYGDPLVHPQPEHYWGHVNPIGERACYDEGKRGAETLLMDARRSWGVDARVVRIFNTYGPRMAFNDGRVVSNFVGQVLRGEALTLFGTGQQTRSFCYVDDLIEGFMRVARLHELCTPLNLGNPQEFTMQELAQEVLSLAGATLPVRYEPLPTDDPRQRKPDISLARDLIDFAPQVPLRKGLWRTIQDFSQRLQAQGEQQSVERSASRLASGVSRKMNNDNALLATSPSV